ncbi:MAG: hypothetical protein QOG89_592, partial [Thermomicrobiales bacterium]|nr:hypothetical protein [Thermomicrobiales bacterium]
GQQPSPRVRPPRPSPPDRPGQSLLPARPRARLGTPLACSCAVGTGGTCGLSGLGSLFDNWRQLVGAPFRVAQRFPSQRVEYDPPSGDVRTATLLLLGITLIPVACLLARHVAGYVLQVIFAFGANVLWIPLFAIRQRLNVNLAFGFDGSWTSPLDVLGYALFVLLAWLFELSLMLLLFSFLLATVALPVTLALDLLRCRQPRAVADASAFFGSLSQRAGSAGPPPSPSA